MKKLLICLFVLGGCASISSSSVGGIYSCNYENEFYRIKDTLIVKSINNKVYQIDRRTTVNKNHKKEKWILTYDEEKKILNEMKRGKSIFVRNGNLIFGNRMYKKITP